MIAVEYPTPPFAHLMRLTDVGGLHEHAEGLRPRTEHGYCVDDVARALVVVSRENETDEKFQALRRQYLLFVLEAQGPDGRFRNRKSTAGVWTGEPSVEDCWGRGLWALGAAAARPTGGLTRAVRAERDVVLGAFERAARWRSPWTRAMTFAGLGAVEMLTVQPGHLGARALLVDAVAAIRGPAISARWRWPEPRLTYANAAVPEVLIGAGAMLGHDAVLAEGLSLLGWLLERETRDGHLSVTPVGGQRPPGLRRATLRPATHRGGGARRCLRPRLRRHRRTALGRCCAPCRAWFLGHNDTGVPLFDPDSGGGCDGLEAGGRNENQGAESTIALITALQQVRAVSLCAA